MNLKRRWTVILSALAAGFGLATTGSAQVSADALLNKLVERGVLTAHEAAELKDETLTNNPNGPKFKISDAIKSMELFGDLRFRYEYRSGELGPGQGYDVADRFRYALRVGVRGELTDDFYYGIRLETSPNERSTWNTFGNAGGSGQSPYVGPFSKNNNYTMYIGQAYLGWRPTSWLDLSVGRVAQPLYTTPMVWDSDYTPEGVVEKVKWTIGAADLFGNFGQYVYQDTTPSDGALAGSGTPDGGYLISSQMGVNYHIQQNLSVKIAPVLYNYLGNGSPSAAFSGTFVGQGEPNGLNYASLATTSSSLPSLNQTGINNLFIFELPGEVNFKLGSLDARVFGDFAINLEGDQRASAAFNAAPKFFPAGEQLDQDKAYQVGVAIGNNLGLVYGTTPKKGTWEARAYWQHVEQYALDPNLLDSDFFEGRGNLEGFYSAFAYSISDGIIGTVRYGWAERIDSNLGTGGFNADLPLPNPITKYQVLQLDVTWKF